MNYGGNMQLEFGLLLASAISYFSYKFFDLSFIGASIVFCVVIFIVFQKNTPNLNSHTIILP